MDEDQVEVFVEGGVVTLTGEVASLHEMTLAVEEAYEVGATDVETELDIEGAATYIDALF